MSQNKRIIAITGIIGSGKSSVTKILSQNGEFVISCDEINAELLKSEEYLVGLYALFPEAFDKGVLNKDLLKNLIFTSKEKRKMLNIYSHAKIKEKLIKMITTAKANRIFVEIPLLNQTDFENIFSEIWIVECDSLKRINRISNRDSIDINYASKIISSQSNNYDFKKKAIIVKNDGTIDDLRDKIMVLLNE